MSSCYESVDEKTAIYNKIMSDLDEACLKYKNDNFLSFCCESVSKKTIDCNKTIADLYGKYKNYNSISCCENVDENINIIEEKIDKNIDINDKLIEYFNKNCLNDSILNSYYENVDEKTAIYNKIMDYLNEKYTKYKNNNTLTIDDCKNNNVLTIEGRDYVYLDYNDENGLRLLQIFKDGD